MFYVKTIHEIVSEIFRLHLYNVNIRFVLIQVLLSQFKMRISTAASGPYLSTPAGRISSDPSGFRRINTDAARDIGLFI